MKTPPAMTILGWLVMLLLAVSCPASPRAQPATATSEPALQAPDPGAAEPAQPPAAALQHAVPGQPRPAAPLTGLSPDQVKALLALLQDQGLRDQLTRQLQASEAKPVPPPNGKPGTNNGASAVAHGAFGWIGSHLHQARESAAASFRELPDATRWFGEQAGTAAGRSAWASVAAAIGLAAAAGVVAGVVVWRVLAGPRRVLCRQHAAGRLRRAAFLLALLAVRAIPFAVFGVAAFTTLARLAPDGPPHEIGLLLLRASALFAGLVLFAAAMAAPGAPGLRLLTVSDAGASGLGVLTAEIAGTALLLWFLIAAAQVMGLPQSGVLLLFKADAFVTVVLLVIAILRHRWPVAAWLHGRPARSPREELGHTDLLAISGLRRGFAARWHLFAIAYLALGYGLLVLEMDRGSALVLRGTVVCAVVLVAATLAMRAIDRVAQRAVTGLDTTGNRYYGLGRRSSRYVPWLALSGKAVVCAAGLLLAFEAWRVTPFAILGAVAGTRIVGAAVDVGLTLLAAIAVWELAGCAIEHRLARGKGTTTDAERAARLRTLLPLAQSVLRLVLLVVVGLTLLSELGVNAAPLLAGAGVIGVAVGFGSQSLVKDVITGLFILAENSLAVGDVVKVAGSSGMVESISIRTIRLRDLDGSVYVIPFSEVTTVANRTKDYSYSMLEIGVAYRQDADEVMQALTAIGADLQADSAFGSDILEPIEILGIDSFGTDKVVIKARIKSRPSRQWVVGREFNRRMKRRFLELGIEIPSALAGHAPEPEAAPAKPGGAPADTPPGKPDPAPPRPDAPADATPPATNPPATSPGATGAVLLPAPARTTS